MANAADGPLSSRVLITGGSGFLGGALVAALVAAGRDVVVAGRRRPDDLPAGVDWVKAELTDPDTRWGALIEGCTDIYHCAWSTIPRTAESDPATDVTENVAGTVRLLEAARRAGGKRIVFCSSGGTIYGNPATLPVAETAPRRPISAYGAGKAAAEQYCLTYARAHAVDVRIVRVGNPYGPGQRASSGLGAIAIFARAALSGRSIEIWGDGEIVRDYVFVDDVVAGLRAAMAAPLAAFGGEEPVFNLGSGIGASLNEIVALLETLLERPVAVTRLERRGFDVDRIVLDIGKAKLLLGWAPQVPLREGVRRSLAAWQAAAQPAGAAAG